MENQKTDLMTAIDDFLSVTGMGPSYFGKVAANNSELVSRLKRGRRVWPETEQKIRDYIAKNTPPATSGQDTGAA